MRASRLGETGLRRFGRLVLAPLWLLAASAMFALMYLGRPVLIILLVSLLLAIMVAPVVSWLHRVRVPRPVGALIATGAILAAVYGIAYVSVDKAIDLFSAFPTYQAKLHAELGKVWHQAEQVRQATEGALGQEQNVVKVQQTRSWTALLASAFGSVTEPIFLASMVPFLVYFMLSTQERMHHATVLLFSRQHRERAAAALSLIVEMLRRFLVGNLVIGVVGSVVAGAVFGIVGVPFFYLIGVISGFLSLVPYVGVILAMAPPLIAGLGQVSSTGVLVIIGTVFGVHLFALNVLYPKLLGARVDLNPLVVTIALLLWGWLWGALGLILAVPIVAAVKIVFDQIETLRPYGIWLGEAVPAPASRVKPERKAAVPD